VPKTISKKQRATKGPAFPEEREAKEKPIFPQMKNEKGKKEKKTARSSYEWTPSVVSKKTAREKRDNPPPLQAQANPALANFLDHEYAKNKGGAVAIGTLS